MRYATDEQRKQAILDSKWYVRSQALEHFVCRKRRDPSIMPLCVEAVERFGTSEAFADSARYCRLMQTEPTIDWILRQLANDELPTPIRNELAETVLIADLTLLAPRREAILQLEIDANVLRAFECRVQYASSSAADLWRRLDELADDGANERYDWQVIHREGASVAEALARFGDVVDARMMEALPKAATAVKGNGPIWMETFFIFLAGERRLAPAIPHLLDVLAVGDDIASEDAQRALQRIGGDEVVARIEQRWSKESMDFRILASSVLESVDTDFSRNAIWNILQRESDDGLRSQLLQTLLMSGCDEAIPLAQKLCRKVTGKGRFAAMFVDLGGIKTALVAACDILGKTIPELPEWRDDVEETQRRLASDDFLSTADDLSDLDVDGFDDREGLTADDGVRPTKVDEDESEVTMPIRRDDRIGRNDKCPCGSGKKFKQCCMKR